MTKLFFVMFTEMTKMQVHLGHVVAIYALMLIVGG